MPADNEFNNYAVASVTTQFDFSKVLAGHSKKMEGIQFCLESASGQFSKRRPMNASGKVAADALTLKNNSWCSAKYQHRSSRLEAGYDL